jgi:c-di-GMP-binding flagellar brake protein YcgR
MNKSKQNRRNYVRLDAIFPVEFQPVNDKKEPKSPMLQGFTRNIGKGGMCIEVKSEKGKIPFEIIPELTKLKLTINIPSSALATDSYATVKWSKKISEYVLDSYIFGIEYDEIESDNQKMIERHVLWLHRRPKVILLFFLVLLFFSIFFTYISVRIR